ncbi:hypothetical protein KKC32_00465 [Patescibacteria group bacterium]|nr:hypothetical protein [Patescibacteria group bacterium]
MRRNLLLIIFVAILAFGSTGCITLKQQTTPATALGGIFASADSGETWKNSSQLLTPGATAGSIANVDVYFMRFDPSDKNTIYAGTRVDGLYYSYNAGAGWTKSEKLPAGFVRDMAVDPKNKCNLYAAVESNIYNSKDCARTWTKIWYSDNATNKIAAMDIDWYESKTIYAGLSDGSLIKSDDGGVSWKLSNKFKSRVNKIIVDPNDSRIVYAGVLSRGLYKTTDKGVNWVEQNTQMKDFKNATEFYDFAVSKQKKDLILYASKFGLLRSLDGGTTWAQVKLLTQPGAEIIYSIAIDPSDANNVYYGTDKAFYKSVDGGETWVVKKMPTTRVAGDLMVDPSDGKKIFMGVKAIEE